MRLNDILSRPLLTIEASSAAETAWTTMRAKGVHHLGVTSEGKLVGVLSERDLGGRRGPGVRVDKTAGDLMTAPVVTAGPTTTIREAANLLRGRVIGCLPVVRRGKPIGIVTVSDLLELIGRGVEHPIEHTTRWTLRRRGPRRKPVVRDQRAR
jgi:acetoin utilization protein AcuB